MPRQCLDRNHLGSGEERGGTATDLDLGRALDRLLEGARHGWAARTLLREPSAGFRCWLLLLRNIFVSPPRSLSLGRQPVSPSARQLS